MGRPSVMPARFIQAITASVILLVAAVVVFGVWMVPPIVTGVGGAIVLYMRHKGRRRASNLPASE